MNCHRHPYQELYEFEVYQGNKLVAADLVCPICDFESEQEKIALDKMLWPEVQFIE